MMSNASGKAAAAQEEAAQNANTTQLAELQATAGLETPGRNLGYGADALLAQLFGLPNPNAAGTTNGYAANSSLDAIGGLPGSVTGGAGSTGSNNIGSTGSTNGGSSTPNYSNFYNSPNYQFALSQGQQAVNRGAAANGSLYSANTLNQLDTNAQGVASQQYNNYVQQLMGLAGIGGAATASTVGSATTAGNNISANQLSAGNANASGILGQGSAYAGAINNVGGVLGNYAQLSGNGTTTGYQGLADNYDSQADSILSSDRRLKRDIVPSHKDPITELPVYEFAYIGSPAERHYGFMADEVCVKFPEAVLEDSNGFLMVNYSAVRRAAAVLHG